MDAGRRTSTRRGREACARASPSICTFRSASRRHCAIAALAAAPIWRGFSGCGKSPISPASSPRLPGAPRKGGNHPGRGGGAVTPRVSVIVPTRDRLTMLRRALAGVQAQRFGDFEVIVVDDGSADETAEWLRSRRTDIRLVTSTTPGGAAAARNRGLDSARGELVAFLDSDDIWQPSYLDEQVAHLDR